MPAPRARPAIAVQVGRIAWGRGDSMARLATTSRLTAPRQPRRRLRPSRAAVARPRHPARQGAASARGAGAMAACGFRGRRCRSWHRSRRAGAVPGGLRFARHPALVRHHLERRCCDRGGLRHRLGRSGTGRCVVMPCRCPARRAGLLPISCGIHRSSSSSAAPSSALLAWVKARVDAWAWRLDGAPAAPVWGAPGNRGRPDRCARAATGVLARRSTS